MAATLQSEDASEGRRGHCPIEAVNRFANSANPASEPANYRAGLVGRGVVMFKRLKHRDKL